jgi:hypothetical protein
VASSVLHASERLVVASDFVEAVHRGDWDRADEMRDELGAMLSDECLTALATLHLHRERWSDAAETLGHIKQPTHEQRFQRTLARNLDALRTHRPAVYRAVADSEIGQTYQIHASKSGLPSILATRADGSRVLLAGGVDPQAAATQVCGSLKPAFERGTSLAILSIGDGYVFDSIVRQSPTLSLGRRQAIFFFEPDPRLVFACMLLHDFTGPNGPIESQNVLWYVGPKWAEQFRLDVLTDHYLPFPQTTIKLGHNPQPIEQALQSALGELGATDLRSTNAVRTHYAPLTASDFSRAIAGDAGRPPRVLLITTRFSTVLQYSTRDTADAFRQIGWDAHVVIEPTPHHGLTRIGMRRAIAEFKPDLIFQIDHNRFEHADLIPPNIPFVNWIQDLLPHLMRPETGRQLSARDFVLTPSLQRWVDDYAYPASQCLEFRKLTRVPSRPTSWSSRGDRVVYVSNWSQTPQQMRCELLRNETGQKHGVIDAACTRMIALYESGQALPTQGDVRRVLTDVMRDLQVAADESLIRHTTTRLFDRMNNLLFRQQGLRWAQRACALLDLDLEIYGTGWDAHPDFASNARGPINYGDELETLTRDAGINLVLEPFVSIAHQRLLDALVAGGFCLVRETPGNAILEALVEIVAQAGDALESAHQIAAAWDGTDRAQTLHAVLAACGAIDACNGADPIVATRRLIRTGFLQPSGELIPMLRQTSFNSPEQLTLVMTRYSRDSELRSDISRQQRRAVEDRYSYRSGVQRVASFIAERLAQEADHTLQAA